MTTLNHHEEPIDLRLLRKLRQAREDGSITGDDRIVFFAHDEPVSLHSAFGHRADDATFNGIVTANFRAMNPGLVKG